MFSHIVNFLKFILIHAGILITISQAAEEFLAESLSNEKKVGLVIGLHGYGQTGDDAKELRNFVISQHSRFRSTLGSDCEQKLAFWFPTAENHSWFEKDSVKSKNIIKMILKAKPPYEKMTDLSDEFIKYKANLLKLNYELQEKIKAYNLTLNDVLLYGFSQGGMMAYSLAVMQKERVNALFLIHSLILPTSITTTPISIYVKANIGDTIIPPMAALKSAEIFKAHAWKHANVTSQHEVETSIQVLITIGQHRIDHQHLLAVGEISTINHLENQQTLMSKL